MRRYAVLFSLIVSAGLIFSCGDDDAGVSGAPGGGSSTPLDWFTSACGDLGGVSTPAGACFVACDSNDDCPLDILGCKGEDVWTVGQCEVNYPSQQTLGCGPAGWYTEDWGCYMICSADGADHECPSGFRCIEKSTGTNGFFCTGYAGSTGGSCGTPCPSGCCSPSGLTCCQPPFCSGVCVGSSCC